MTHTAETARRRTNWDFVRAELAHAAVSLQLAYFEHDTGEHENSIRTFAKSRHAMNEAVRFCASLGDGEDAVVGEIATRVAALRRDMHELESMIQGPKTWTPSIRLL